MFCERLDILQSHVPNADCSSRKPGAPIGFTYHVDSQRTERGGGVTAWSGLLDTERKMSPKAIFTLRRVFECEHYQKSSTKTYPF